jgi:hypothetical protein
MRADTFYSVVHLAAYARRRWSDRISSKGTPKLVSGKVIVLELLSHAGIPVARLADAVGVNRAITHRHLEAYLNAVYESAGPPRRFRFYRAIDLERKTRFDEVAGICDTPSSASQPRRRERRCDRFATIGSITKRKPAIAGLSW